MSITRITRGELKNTSTSMNLSANDGNYQFNSPTKNQWQGNEDGIIEDKYEAPNKEDVLSNSINVRLNLFFDGTQNNKTNTEAKNKNSPNHNTYNDKGNKNDDSFENDYTNVARGFDAVDSNVENQLRIYIEGIGTEDLKSDSVASGVSMGEGDTGITAKVTKGCMDASEGMFKKNYQNKDIDILFVNVYGFSRGAAAARHFIHVANKTANYSKIKKIDDKKTKYKVYPEFFFNDKKYYLEPILETTVLIEKHGYFGACLLSKGMKIKEIKFNFVGIYDTVASHGVYHGNDVSDLKLNSVAKANYVFHLASQDEYRENFDLSNINSAGVKGLELTLPGVHSDIGGSYLNNVLETSVIYNNECVSTEEEKNKAKYYYEKKYDAFKKIVIDEGWYLEGQIKKEFFYEKELDKFAFWTANQYNYGLIGRRQLLNTYDKIPLKLMIEKSKNFKVFYDEDKLKRNEISDSFINSIYNQLLGYTNLCVKLRNEYVEEYNKNLNNGSLLNNLSKEYLSKIKQLDYKSYIDEADLKKLRNKYLHWSVKENSFGLGPRFSGALTQDKRKREIHNG